MNFILKYKTKWWYIPRSWPCALAFPRKCNREKPFHSLTVPLGQAGVWIVCECLVKKKPRLLGEGPGGAGSPLEPGKPAKEELTSNEITVFTFSLEIRLLYKVTEVIQ